MAKKSLGQNFLMHPQIAERIVKAAQLAAKLPVLEIGPGTGMLTRALLGAGHPVVAVEADRELIPKLEETFADDLKRKRLTLLNADIRAFDTKVLPKRYALVANIPYYITGEIIRTFLTAKHKPESITLLVQKEVAERIARSKKESLLSLSVKAFGTPEYCFKVPAGAFRPAPKVDSAVIAIRGIGKGGFRNASDEARFFELIRAGFAHKRKLLASNLGLAYETSEVKKAFEKAGLPAKARAEDLNLTSWKVLHSVL